MQPLRDHDGVRTVVATTLALALIGQLPSVSAHGHPQIVQNPPTGTVFAADNPETVQVQLVHEDLTSHVSELLQRNTSVETGAHSVLYAPVSETWRDGVTDFAVGPFHATAVSADRPEAQDDVLFNSVISTIIPPGVGHFPTYIKAMQVRFVRPSMDPWPDIPMWLREFTLIKVHDPTRRCRSSEFRVADLEPYDDYRVDIPRPYGLLMHDPDAADHRWAFRIEVEDGRMAIGGKYPEGQFDFYLQVTFEWTEEPHWNTHRVKLDAMGCPTVLDKRHLVGL